MMHPFRLCRHQSNTKNVGTFLYYGIAIDNTILVPLGTIASEQSSVASNTAKKITQLLNYLATHPDATIRYKRSYMVLWVHSVQPRWDEIF